MSRDHDAVVAVPRPPRVPGDAELAGQTVVVIGGTDGVGLETARRARTAGAEVVLTGADAVRLREAAAELAPVTTAILDTSDRGSLDRFFQQLPRPVDHVLVTAAGPHRARLADFDFVRAEHDVDEHLLLPIRVARAVAGAVRPGGTLLFLGGTGDPRRGAGRSLSGALTAARPALIANLALEIAPIRVNLIGACYVSRPLSAGLLGRTLHHCLDEENGVPPIGRVVRPPDVPALAVHVMADTALTGATFDVDDPQRLCDPAPGVLGRSSRA